MNLKKKFTIPPLEKKLRLDQVLVRLFPKTSRAYWKKRGLDDLRINHARVFASDLLSGGEVLELFPPEEAKDVQANPLLPLRILMQNENFIFVCKEAACHSLPKSSEETETVVNAVLARFPEQLCLGVENKRLEAGLLNRLDFKTSGILIFARHENAYENYWVYQDKVRKKYFALVQGCMSGSGCIDFPLKKKNNRRMKVMEEENSKNIPASTQYRVLDVNDEISFLELEIHRGQRHQIRAHLAHLGYPILGEDIYDQNILGSQDFYCLHAAKVFIPEELGGPYWVEAPIPDQWALLFRGLPYHGKDVSAENNVDS